MPQVPAIDGPLAVLVSGGLDSAVLLGESLAVRPAVCPVYIRTGSAWESVEQKYLHRFLDAVRRPALKPLTILEQPAGIGVSPARMSRMRSALTKRCFCPAATCCSWRKRCSGVI